MSLSIPLWSTRGVSVRLISSCIVLIGILWILFAPYEWSMKDWEKTEHVPIRVDLILIIPFLFILALLALFLFVVGLVVSSKKPEHHDNSQTK